MYRQSSKRKPDFFAILVLLVMLSFGITVMIQWMASNLENVTVSQPATPPSKTLQAKS
jgi:hypothetical protein